MEKHSNHSNMIKESLGQIEERKFNANGMWEFLSTFVKSNKNVNDDTYMVLWCMILIVIKRENVFQSPSRFDVSRPFQRYCQGYTIQGNATTHSRTDIQAEMIAATLG